MNPARTNSGGALPVSPIDVVEYLVQNEPLTHVAEISRRVDEYASQLEQDSFAAESLNTAIDTEKRVSGSVDELLREFQGFYFALRKRMKEAENAIDTRSQDLQQAIARLHDTPLTTPPTPSLGVTSPSIAQISAKVEEIGMAQTEVLSALEANRDKLKVALGELPNRGESIKPFLSKFMKQTYETSPSTFGSPWERYHRGSQEFLSGVDRIVENSETIRDLALVLERVRDLDFTIAPLTDKLPTLAEELSAWQAQDADATAVPPSNPYNRVLRWSSSTAYFELLKVWVERPTRDSLAFFTHLRVRPSFLVSASLVVLLFILVNVMRARYFTGNSDHGRSVTQTATSIRDILLGDKASMSDELIHNLVPRG